MGDHPGSHLTITVCGGAEREPLCDFGASPIHNSAQRQGPYVSSRHGVPLLQTVAVSTGETICPRVL